MIRDCWYNGVCDKYATEYCSTHCLRYSEMLYLMQDSGLPIARQRIIKLECANVDYDSFLKLAKIKDNIKAFVSQGQNLYICGLNNGNGKTSWSIKLLQSYFNAVWYGNRFRTRGLFISVSNLLNDFRRSVADKNFNIYEITDKIKTADLVVWDDIGCVVLTDYTFSNLLNLIDERVLACKANIFTGNIVDADTMLDILGSKLTSRIWSTSVRIELKGIDRRNALLDFDTSLDNFSDDESGCIE